MFDTKKKIFVRRKTIDLFGNKSSEFLCKIHHG